MPAAGAPNKFVSVIYKPQGGEQDEPYCGETIYAAVESTRGKKKSYGRQISEIQPEEVLTKTGQGQQRQSTESTDRRCQTVRRQEKVGGPHCCLSRDNERERQFRSSVTPRRIYDSVGCVLTSIAAPYLSER